MILKFASNEEHGDDFFKRMSLALDEYETPSAGSSQKSAPAPIDFLDFPEVKKSAPAPIDFLESTPEPIEGLGPNRRTHPKIERIKRVVNKIPQEHSSSVYSYDPTDSAKDHSEDDRFVDDDDLLNDDYHGSMSSPQYDKGNLAKIIHDENSASSDKGSKKPRRMSAAERARRDVERGSHYQSTSGSESYSDELVDSDGQPVNEDGDRETQELGRFTFASNSLGKSLVKPAYSVKNKVIAQRQANLGGEVLSELIVELTKCAQHLDNINHPLAKKADALLQSIEMTLAKGTSSRK